MLTEAVSRRYAKALFEAALAQKALDTVKHELSEFVGVLGKEERLRVLWNSSRLPDEEKKELIRKYFPGLSTLVLHFLYLLIRKQREKIIVMCLEEYEKYLLQFYNQLYVEVESSAPVPPAVQNELKERLTLKLGKRVELILSENPLLIGGMILKIGDRVIDGSVRAKLEGLREDLIKQNAFVG